MHRRLFVLSWLVGIPGVVAVSLFVVPALVAGRPSPLPLWVVQLVSTLQSAVFLAAAAWAGAALASRVGLSAPVLAAIAAARWPGPELRAQLRPGLLGGVAGSLLLWAFSRGLPPALALAQTKTSIPVSVRLLYGGITEELLLRWGLMTLLVWGLRLLWPRGTGAPPAAVLWAAIVISALLFGVGHLPAAALLLGGHLGAGVGAYLVLANAAFGLLAGWLYARSGLEAAMLAHVSAHALFLLLTAVG